MARSITITAYDRGWKASFEKEAAQLHCVLGANAVQIHHIGSTAVPGLWAKPIIDILVEASDLHAFDALSPTLNGLGYQARGENGIAGRRYFTKGGEARTHHLHVYPQGSDNVLRHLCVRDFLLAHPQAAVAYGEMKRACARQHGNVPLAYADAKDKYVQALEQQAIRCHFDRLERTAGPLY